MLKNFSLFKKINENFGNENPWSEKYLELYPNLKELKNSLEIGMYNGEEYVILHHFGSNLAWIDGKLDPKFFRSNMSTSEDEKQLAFKVTMFYVDLKDREKQFNSNHDYFKIRYPLRKLYPLTQDPLDINIEIKKKDDDINLKNFIVWIKNRMDNSIDTLNSTWKTELKSFDDITFDIVKNSYNANGDYVYYKHSEFITNDTNIKRIMRGAREKGFNGQILNWKEDLKSEPAYRCDIWEIIPLDEEHLIEHIGKE